MATISDYYVYRQRFLFIYLGNGFDSYLLRLLERQNYLKNLNMKPFGVQFNLMCMGNRSEQRDV